MPGDPEPVEGIHRADLRTWRLLDSGPCEPAYNMALDEALSRSVRNGAPPVLRFYEWSCQALTLGAFQRTGDLDRGSCAAAHIPVVRRPTGGRAVLHRDGLTYSFSVQRVGVFSGSLLESYQRIGEALCLGFRSAGISAELKSRREPGRVLTHSPLCFASSSYAEVLIAGRKIAGSAQRRWPDGLLQQGSIPFTSREDEVRRLFRNGPGQQEKEQEQTGLSDIVPELNSGRLRGALAEAFEECFTVRLVPALPLAEEEALAQELLESKYLREEWNFRL